MSNNTQIYSCNQIKRENENLRLNDMYVYNPSNLFARARLV